MTGPHPDPLALDAHLEPAAMAAPLPNDVPADAAPFVQAALSAAISLKRIADALQQLTSADDTHNAGTLFGAALSEQLIRGPLSPMAMRGMGESFGRGLDRGKAKWDGDGIPVSRADPS